MEEYGMIGRSVRRRVFWVMAAASVALMLYLAFAVFGVHKVFYDDVVNEDFAAGRATGEGASGRPEGLEAVASGEFHAVAHPGAGKAIVYRLKDGSYTLRLENLDIFNGPDLYVYAVAAGDADDDETVLESGFLNLGRLKGNQGNQTYALPDGFDPEEHRAISVWCRRFSVNFATAPLKLVKARYNPERGRGKG
jgi:hypothetical protein